MQSLVRPLSYLRAVLEVSPPSFECIASPGTTPPNQAFLHNATTKPDAFYGTGLCCTPPFVSTFETKLLLTYSALFHKSCLPML